MDNNEYFEKYISLIIDRLAMVVFHRQQPCRQR